MGIVVLFTFGLSAAQGAEPEGYLQVDLQAAAPQVYTPPSLEPLSSAPQPDASPWKPRAAAPR